MGEGEKVAQQRKAGRPRKRGRDTASNEEFAQRIEFAALLLGRDVPSSQAKQQLVAKYSVTVRMAEIYIAQARDLLVEWSGRTREEHFLESVSFWKSVVQAPGSSMADRMRAREKLDELYHLAKAREVAEPPKIHIHEVVVRSREEASAMRLLESRSDN